MNREIKFRAWDKANKEMLEVEALFFVTGGIKTFQKGKGERFLHKNLSVLEQFTGLRDKNGKEIYEGDIFIAKILPTSTGRHVKVVFEAPTFDVEDKNGDRAWNLYSVITNGEVIGNIHENPELLKV